VSRGGGAEPRWRRDGKELYFLQRGGVMAVEIDARAEPASVGTARELFDIDEAGALPTYHYDVSADGARFVFVREVKERASEPVLVVTENWFAEFSSTTER
jgi:hypothetical protein